MNSSSERPEHDFIPSPSVQRVIDRIGENHEASAARFTSELFKLHPEYDEGSVEEFEIQETQFYGRMAPRSGLAMKFGIDVLTGVIDADYRGEFYACSLS